MILTTGVMADAPAFTAHPPRRHMAALLHGMDESRFVIRNRPGIGKGRLDGVVIPANLTAGHILMFTRFPAA